MAILNWAKEQTALFLTGSNTTYPTYFMIGSGSGTVVATQSALLGALDRQAVTATNGSTVQKVKWTGDWNSVEMSGLTLREFGVTVSGTGTTGSMWSRIGIANGVTFDGTTELRIEENWEVF